MSSFQVIVSKVIDAPSEAVYNVIIDMDEHRKILPKEFTALTVEKGGRGAGTVVRAEMQVMGVKAAHRLVISEPEPGRIMKEVDTNTGVDTTWTVTPRDGGQRCELKLDTVMRVKPGFQGWVEKLITPGIMRGMYRRELDQIAAYVRTKQ
ncbi:MAG: Polyketide cyclase / dehydrase and lipid transport [Symbiobacteriaceae bacterium]|jgi:uncharacterized protein YndB with AHSA1/START domain|nr:Polyketide cyclase / dehydrase and lipid transport [Symbiobacteriaceae bacterium]